MWTYMTCGMSWPDMPQLLELHLFSLRQSPELVDLLTTVAHYHQTAHALGVDPTVNFGEPLLLDSACSCGLV